MVSIAALLQYLYEGDFLGFLQAVYVSAFQSADIFYAVVIMLFTVPMYIRTKSVLLLCILWILLGGLVIVATPLVAGMSVFIVGFGIAGLLYRLYLSVRG